MKVLIIGAHHEEIEAECPNIPIQLTKAGCEVQILNPIGGWNWTFIRDLGPGGRERTMDDATSAARGLGCSKVIWDYPVAKCDAFRDEIIERMAEHLLRYAPDIVLMHWPLDSHADHRLVAHVTRHVLGTAPNISPNRYPDFRRPKEIYAFQTGVSQAYHYIPDFFVKADEESMAQADRAVACFAPTAPECVPVWRENFHSKAAYWANSAGCPAEPLKFIGPQLPVDGFLLRKILGDKFLPAPFERFCYDSNFQL